MPRKLTLADVEPIARREAAEWWDSLTNAQKLQVLKRYNEAQAAEDFMARQFQGPAKKARS